MQAKGAEVVDHGVAGVGATLVTRDHRGLGRQVIDDSSLPFVSPLGADDDKNRHAYLAASDFVERQQPHIIQQIKARRSYSRTIPLAGRSKKWTVSTKRMVPRR